jgi:hypothetical protein
MTHDDNAPDTALPKFPVNVAPTSKITSGHLSSLLRRFRSGDVEPLVFGDDNTPEAVVIPFAAFVRLMKSDHAAHIHEEAAFQGDLSRRIQDSGDASGAAMTVGEFAGSLGPLGSEWTEEHRTDMHKGSAEGDG